MSIWSYFFGAALFIICHKIKQPCLRLESFLDENSFGDFMEANGITIDLTNNMCAPAFVGVVLSIFKQTDMLAEVSGWLCFLQTILLFCALFITRVSEVRSALYVSFMPELTHYSFILAMNVMPILVIAYNLVGYFFLIEDVTLIYPFLVYTIFV